MPGQALDVDDLALARQDPLRVLIVGINYAPEHSGIAPYTTEAAEHWAARGHDVRMVTGVAHYPHWTVPEEMRRRRALRETRNGVEIRRLRHYVPRRQSALRRAVYEWTFGLHVAISERWAPDVVVAVVPSLVGAAVAARIARRARVPFVLWLQDLMGQAAAQSGIRGGGTIARATRLLERWVACQADVVAVASEGFRAHIASYGIDDSRIARLPNWAHVSPPSADRDETRRRLGWDDGRTVALHTGNMGLKQGLENVVAAGRLADNDGGRPVRFVLMGEGSQRRTLEDLSRDLSSVELMPPVPRDDYPNVLHAADVLIVNERVGVLDMSLPSKLTSYFVAGRPVVAATDSISGTAYEVRRAEAGAVVHPGDPTTLLDAVREWGGNGKRAADAGRAAVDYAQLVLSSTVAGANLDELLLLTSALAHRNVPKESPLKPYVADDATGATDRPASVNGAASVNGSGRRDSR